MNLKRALMISFGLALLAGCGSSGSGGGNDSGTATVAADATPDQPYTIHKNRRPWKHWSGSNQQTRPSTNNWKWDNVKRVRCSAQDSRGHFYVVVEDGYVGVQYQGQINQIEDSAVDRCYADSKGDAGCRVSDCSPD